MFHSDLKKEIAYQQARLTYKREQLAKALEQKESFAALEGLHQEISEIEQKLQVCFAEANTQLDNN